MFFESVKLNSFFRKNKIRHHKTSEASYRSQSFLNYIEKPFKLRRRHWVIFPQNNINQQLSVQWPSFCSNVQKNSNCMHLLCFFGVLPIAVGKYRLALFNLYYIIVLKKFSGKRMLECFCLSRCLRKSSSQWVPLFPLLKMQASLGKFWKF